MKAIYLANNNLYRAPENKCPARLKAKEIKKLGAYSCLARLLVPNVLRIRWPFMGKRAPYIRQSDVGAGLTRVSLSFPFFFFFFFFFFFLTILSQWLCNNSTKTPYLYRTPPEEEEEAKRNIKVCRNKYNFISFSVLFNTLCVLVSSMWFIGEGGNRFSF